MSDSPMPGKMPKGQTPNEPKPVAPVPEGVAPEGVAPEGVAPEGVAPEGVAPEGVVPDDRTGQAAVTPNPVVGVLQAAAQGLLFPSETDAPIEPFFWPEPAPVTPSAELVASHAKAQTQAVKTQSLATFFKPTVTEEEWHNADEKAQVKRFQALLDAVKSNLEAVKVFRVGKVEIEVYVVGRVSEGYAGFKTKVVET